MINILVPTDFSPNANKALYYAAELAKVAGAKIVIIHVTNFTHASMNEAVMLPQRLDKEVMDLANEKLDMLASDIREISMGQVEQQLYNGFVSDAIKQAALENKSDLITVISIRCCAPGAAFRSRWPCCGWSWRWA